MRFTIIYLNQKETRDKVVAELLDLLTKGVNFTETGINHPLFMARPSWPERDALMSMPLPFQCEEIEYLEGSIRTRRVQVIDVECIVD